MPDSTPAWYRPIQHPPLLLHIKEGHCICIPQQQTACASVENVVTVWSLHFFGYFILQIFNHNLTINNSTNQYSWFSLQLPSELGHFEENGENQHVMYKKNMSHFVSWYYDINLSLIEKLYTQSPLRVQVSSHKQFEKDSLLLLTDPPY